jgi:enoyl-CoA hydratase/carnithine racemase
MASLIQAKLSPRVAVDSMTTGRRFAGSEALASGIVDATASEADLVGAATALVAPLAGKDADTLGKIKTTMYAATLAALAAAGQ